MATLTIKVTGVTAMLMHSDRFADPLDPLTKAHKALTSKRKKTDDDHEAIARSEYIGGLYYDDVNGVHVPGANFKSCLVEAAKLNKLGTEFKRSLLVIDECIKLNYEGPQTPEALANDPRYVLAKSVKVGTARLMRHRPRFPAGWSFVASIEYDESRIDPSELQTVLANAGRYIGLGDWRPATGGTYGRFTVEIA